MKSFRETVKDYSLYKESKKGTGVVTKNELYALRHEYREALHRESMKSRMHSHMDESAHDSSFSKVIRDYSEYKMSKCGDSSVSLNERIAIRSAIRSEAMKESKGIANPNSLREAVEGYSAYKKARTGNAKLTREEFEAVKKAYKAESMKESKSSNKSATVIKNLKEAVDCIKLGRHALKEGDVQMAQDMAGQAGAAVDAAGQAAAPVAPMGQPAIDPALVQKITDVKTAVDDLAAAAGVSAPVDLGANPAAGVPPVEGQPAAGAATPDANAAQTGLPESKRIDIAAVRERIAARKASLDEGVAHHEAFVPGGIANTDFAGSTETNPSQLTIPTVKQIEKGTDKDVVRWGPGTTTPPKGVQPVGSVKKESTLPEQDVDHYLERVDFKKIFDQLDSAN
jgi:hypothetical protein